MKSFKAIFVWSSLYVLLNGVSFNASQWSRALEQDQGFLKFEFMYIF